MGINAGSQLGSFQLALVYLANGWIAWGNNAGRQLCALHLHLYGLLWKEAADAASLLLHLTSHGQSAHGKVWAMSPLLRCVLG